MNLCVLVEETTKEIIRKAAEAVGSLSDTEFDVRFNPDCYCDTVIHADDEDLQRQRRLVNEAAQFLLTNQIPQFIRQCLDHAIIPIDGSNLSEHMHQRGINMRYLGKIYQHIESVEQLDFLKVLG